MKVPFLAAALALAALPLAAQTSRDTPMAPTNPPVPQQTQPTDPSLQRGESVKKAQEALNQQGYNVGEPNGEMNEPTRSAVRKFQELSGIRPTGALDPNTLRALGVREGM